MIAQFARKPDELIAGWVTLTPTFDYWANFDFRFLIKIIIVGLGQVMRDLVGNKSADINEWLDTQNELKHLLSQMSVRQIFVGRGSSFFFFFVPIDKHRRQLVNMLKKKAAQSDIWFALYFSISTVTKPTPTT